MTRTVLLDLSRLSVEVRARLLRRRVRSDCGRWWSATHQQRLCRWKTVGRCVPPWTRRGVWPGIDADVESAREVAEALVPFEDDDWVLESGYAQNGIAAIAYAVRAWLSDDPQEAVWAARQVYEAADYGAQQSQPAALRVYSAGVEEQLAHAPVVQAAVRGSSMTWWPQARTAPRLFISRRLTLQPTS